MLNHNPEMDLILQKAYEFANKLNHKYVTTEHLALSLINYKNFKIMLEAFGTDYEMLHKELKAYVEQLPIVSKVPTDPQRTHGLERVMNRAFTHVLFSGRRHLQTIDLFLSIMKEERSHITYLFNKYGVSSNKLVDFFNKTYTGENEKELHNEFANEILMEYTTNLNQMATDKKIDPVIGREPEIEEICQVLAKRNKSNVLLIGDPGVGKTAIAEGLAKRIVDGNVPEYLKESKIYNLDIGSLVAGTKYRGEFEERLKEIIAAAKQIPGTIIFIDEAHQMKGAGGGGSAGGPDFMQMLKPALAKGEVKVIASTTWEEFTQSFEKDRAFMRRFYRLTVEEPTPEVAKEILKGLNKYFMDFHKARIYPEALDAAVDLSVRHQPDKKLPDKAIDLIDSACAKQRFLGVKNFKIRKHNIIEELSKATRIPLDQLQVEEKSSTLEHLDTVIKANLYGQDTVVDTVVNKIMVSKAGLKALNKPIGSFLLVGPTGSGKTEFAKLLAEHTQAKLLRFDMSEYQEKHTVARLIGAPPGYVGYEDGNLGGGLLVSQIEKNPHAVILFDEIEKAHPDVSNILLQLMDEGFVTSTNGKKVDARNTIILMTSNLGAVDNEMNNIGFNQELERTGEEDKAVKTFFKPEFRNRLDGTCKFNYLSTEVVRKIVHKYKSEINDLLSEKGIKIEFMEKAVAKLAELGYDKKMGARPLGRVIEDKIKLPLSKKILFESIDENSLISVDFVNEDFVFTHTNTTERTPDELPTESETVSKEGFIVLDKFKPKTT